MDLNTSTNWFVQARTEYDAMQALAPSVLEALGCFTFQKFVEKLVELGLERVLDTFSQTLVGLSIDANLDQKKVDQSKVYNS